MVFELLAGSGRENAPGTKTYTVVILDENALSTWGDYTMTFDLVGKTGPGTDECLMRG
ncbi:MAG: hypothetical protein VYA26_06105 [Actinomycetota bacterium]|nr:hypothetical protein [Actinomycetota bacterium]